MVIVVNVKTCNDFGYKDGDVYIGRGNVRFKESKFANPFPIGKCRVNGLEEKFTRDECISRYAKYLGNGEVVTVNGTVYRGDLARDSLNELLTAKRIGCFCKPAPCHGDILKKYIDSKTKTLNDFSV
jgi:hypothetical protein